jgi:hypothetical protein
MSHLVVSHQYTKTIYLVNEETDHIVILLLSATKYLKMKIISRSMIRGLTPGVHHFNLYTDRYCICLFIITIINIKEVIEALNFSSFDCNHLISKVTFNPYSQQPL